MNQLHATEDATMNVVNVFDLMEAGRFVRCQDCHFLKKPDPESIIVMVSHRWEAKDQPDPDRIQFHGVVRFIIQSCMMAMRSAPNVFNCVDSSEIILSPDLFLILPALYQKYVDEMLAESDQNLFQRDKHLLHQSQQLLRYLLQTIGEQNTVPVGADIAPLAYMMRHFDIWYDFTSLPQAPRTHKEQLYFDQELSKLDRYFSEYYTTIIWSRNSLKRAWCFLEAFISSRVRGQSIFSSENSLVSSTKLSPISELFFTTSSAKIGDQLINFSDLNDNFRNMMQEKNTAESEILRLFNRNKERVDLTYDLSTALQEMLPEAIDELTGKSESEVLSYLTEHEFKCTNGSDIALIAKKLTAHYN